MTLNHVDKLQAYEPDYLNHKLSGTHNKALEGGCRLSHRARIPSENYSKVFDFSNTSMRLQVSPRLLSPKENN